MFKTYKEALDSLPDNPIEALKIAIEWSSDDFGHDVHESEIAISLAFQRHGEDLIKRLADAEAALCFYQSKDDPNIILEPPTIDESGGKRAKAYFEKWGEK